MSTASVFSILDASICVGTVRALPIFARQSETKRMRTIRVRSAGPLISKLRNNEFARKRSRVSSMMSASLGSPKDKVHVNPTNITLLEEMRYHQWVQDHES